MTTATRKGVLDHRRQEVQQAVKAACDQLNSVDGVPPRDYVEQLAWMFFLKAFDELETRLEEEAEFEGGGYERRLKAPYAWSSWTKIKDYDKMLEFVDGKLWKKLTSPDPKTGMGADALAERAVVVSPEGRVDDLAVPRDRQRGVQELLDEQRVVVGLGGGGRRDLRHRCLPGVRRAVYHTIGRGRSRWPDGVSI